MKPTTFYLHYTSLFLFFVFLNACKKNDITTNDLQEQDLEKPERQMIIGGTPVANISSRPYQAFILNNGSGGSMGAGVIIGKQWILTAAHVVDNASSGDLRIRVGSVTRGQGDLYLADQVYFHPDQDADLALVHLSSPIDMTNASVILCEPTPSYFPPYIVSGWGLTDNNNTQSTSTTLLSKSVDIVSKNSKFIKVSNGPCSGDSGGPLTAYRFGLGDVLIGIVSNTTNNCGEANCTRIENYLPWISSIATTITTTLPYFDNSTVDYPCDYTGTVSLNNVPPDAIVTYTPSINGFINITGSWITGFSFSKVSDGEVLVHANVDIFQNIYSSPSSYITLGLSQRNIEGVLPEMLLNDHLSVSVNTSFADNNYKWFLNGVLVHQGSSASTLCTCSGDFYDNRVTGENTIRVEIETDCGIQFSESSFWGFR